MHLRQRMGGAAKGGDVRTIRARGSLVLGFVGLVMLALASSGAASTDPFDLVPGTAVLADNFGSGGNGGNTSSTTSSPNIFSPSVFVDHKRFGGQPNVTVDHYPGRHDGTYVTVPDGV